MIRFLSLVVHNFSLYPDTQLTFSTDVARPLTVIRGENECGKTTLMRAFLWVLYGEEGLPAVPNVMHPIRPVWAEDEPISTRVELRFEARGSRRALSNYKLVREATTEVVGGQVEYRDEKTTLILKQADGNWGAADNQLLELLMHKYFRPELRDFFFIDADKAVRFVGGPEGEHDDSLMRRSTTQAIYNLLGVDSLRRSIDRLEQRRSDFLRQAGRTSHDVNQQQLASELEEQEEKKNQADTNYARLQAQLTAAQDDLRNAKRRLESDVTRMTSLTEVTTRISDVKDTLANARERRAEVISRLSNLIEQDERVAASLMLPAIESVVDTLDPLYRDGKIPPAELTLLPRLLRDRTCVCGIRFDEHPEREHEVERRYRESERLDQNAHFLGHTLEAARQLGNSALGRSARAWEAEVTDCQNQLAELDEVTNGLDAKLEALDAQREAIGAMSEPVYRERRSHVAALEHIRDQLSDDCRIAEAKFNQLTSDVRSLRERLRTAQTGEQRSKGLRDAADAADDLRKVLEVALQAIESRQVLELSSVMNDIFRKVIGATSESNFSEVGVRVVPGSTGPSIEYEPYARDRQKEKPLALANGASRRALAVSFVLALAETTGSSVPFVADSLLHAFSGGVLRRMVGYLVDGQRVGQPILFGHTHDLLDEEIRQALINAAGSTYTVTNESHVGGDVVRAAPQRIHSRQTVVCGCGINEYCDVCEHTSYASDSRFTRRTDSSVYC
ncbi:AAA family ATPase [Streptomyces sp. NPDC047869]|uniref:AAA family ATPase n=1 Tax=Streptomyces sp. NPDC047869 TaxID=3154709 RepID=UPI0034546045